jgi:hypothetical protein
VTAADEGQKLRDDGSLIAARSKFITCAAKGCPAVVSKACDDWLREIERDLPSASFRALDERGKEIADIKVSVDGTALTEPTSNGRVVPLDPGPHTIRFEQSDGKSVEDKIVLHPGEKNRIVELSFAPPPDATPKPAEPVVPVAPEAPQPPSKHFVVPALGWVGLGFAVAGGATAGVFALMANSDESDLRKKCAPHCAETERSPLHTKVVIANIGLAVGIAGAAVAVLSTILANGDSSSPKQSASGPTFSIGPNGTATVHGTF